MSPRVNRPHLRAICDAHPQATYAELARLSGYYESTVARILRNEFGEERRPRFVVVEELKGIRRGASFAVCDFLTSCWDPTWPYGLRVMDYAGEVYEVRGFLRKQAWRQRLVGEACFIEPVNSHGMQRRVGR